ncbi:MAG: SHOCT domain-containing protein [Gammaproteobacteria bacterium]|nr:SHOCT domain-containing protein [Gammaproteobacteria bacterium]
MNVTRRYQKGEVVAAMVVIMVVMMLAFWQGGMRGGHMSAPAPTERTEKTALDLLEEAYARGEISREEYLQKREDLQQGRP